MLKIYSIKDTKGAFLDPVVALNDAVATRLVKSSVNSGKGFLAQYPEDYELWCLGDFDEITGIITPMNLKFVVRLSALKDNVQDA